MSPLYLTLEDPSASEDFDFEIRVVPSVVSLPVDSSLVSLANNSQVRFSMSFLSMLAVPLRLSCRWPLVCPSERNVPHRCLRNTFAGWFWRDEFYSSINLPAVVVPLEFGQFLKLPCWSNRARRKLEDSCVFGCVSISQRTDPRRDVNWSTKWKSERIEGSASCGLELFECF